MKTETIDQIIGKIDGQLFRKQREWLLEQANLEASGGCTDGAMYAEGLICLLDQIADYAHDKLGIDCIID